MSLFRTYIIPHGDEILSLPNKESEEMNQKIKEVTKDDQSETIVIISPHSLRISTGIPVINTVYLAGYYRIGKRVIRRNYESDKDFNYRLIKSAELLVETNFITTEGKLSKFPLDFGAIIPLTFFGKKKVSLIGQWRSNDKEKLISFGKNLYDSVWHDERTISVVFSADQAHSHSKKGPYGYDERAEIYDDMVIKALKTNNFEDLINLDESFISGAKPDSYWNLLTFYGFISKGNLTSTFHYYYLQDYFGMLLATGDKK